MANTALGRDLTDAHRRQQVTEGLAAQLEAEGQWSYLDPDDLDRSTPAWLAATMLALRVRYRSSQRLALAYLSEYREAETGRASGPLRTPPLPMAVTHGLLIGSGPVLVKQAIASGASVEAAMDLAMRQTMGTVGRLAMNGGRGVIDRSARADRSRGGRYRRVSDGNPCAFCAMLVGRGPTYSETSAYFQAHKHCGCTAEPIYGDWTPDELESEWIDSYEQAAKAAREAGEMLRVPNRRSNQDTILWRMRRNRPDLFSDGVHSAA